MGYKAAVQVLKQAEDLKPKVLKKCDLLNDPEAWVNQQKLQSIYHQVLVLDLEYALDKKVEQDLWNIGFKNHITDLQEKARDKKNPHRSDFQALLTWALESASGFYLVLLQELCNTFDIDLPFRRRGNVYGQPTTGNEQVNVPQIASCSYICQYCLVHLGDIARYRTQRRQAENFYKQAILVSPHSGHPYNQLALLEASQGDKLSTVFYYIRGICVKNPFPASTTNLMSVLSSAIDKDSPSEKIQTKMTVNEYIQLFLCAHGYFHTVTDVKQAELAVKSLNSVMTALVATQSFKKQELIKVTIINLYALKHLGKDSDLTKDELRVKDLVLELIAGSLSAFLMPVYTLQSDESLLEYYALPAVKFLMYFITNQPEILKCRVFKERMQIWPSLCKLVNAAQGILIGFNYNKFSRCSLQEDRDLQGFLPLQQNLKDFSFKDEIEDSEVESKVRMRRIIDFGIWLCGYDFDGTKLITKTESKGLINFEPVLSQPDPTNDLLEEMKSFTIKESKENKNNFPEKKAGILKPQGSLEKSREEREVKKNTDNVASEVSQKVADSVRSKRSKQNVALQSIFKKMEESKQVKFNVEDNQDKDKSVKFDQPPPAGKMPPQQTPLIPLNQPNQFANPPPSLRTQSFNQNHPAFPLQSNPQNQQITQSQPPTDYLTSLRNLGKGADNMMPQFSKNSPFSNLPPNGGGNSNQQNQQALKLINYPPPFNVPPPQFNAWGREDLKLTPSGGQNSWWGQNTPPQNQGFAASNQVYTSQTQSAFAPQPRAEAKPQNYSNQSYQAQTQNYPTQRPQDNSGFAGMNYPGFNLQYQNQLIKPPPLQSGMQNMASGGQYDVFTSPWGGGANRGAGFAVDDMSQSSMSMRQAMLKEATFTGGRMGISQQAIPQSPDQHLQSQTPGYSLFNNSWAPNLPGQLRNNKMADTAAFNGPQHSLFRGHGPQSLAQLLEHQQNQMGVAPSGRNGGSNQES